MEIKIRSGNSYEEIKFKKIIEIFSYDDLIFIIIKKKKFQVYEYQTGLYISQGNSLENVKERFKICYGSIIRKMILIWEKCNDLELIEKSIEILE